MFYTEVSKFQVQSLRLSLFFISFKKHEIGHKITQRVTVSILHSVNEFQCHLCPCFHLKYAQLIKNSLDELIFQCDSNDLTQSFITARRCSGCHESDTSDVGVIEVLT